MDNSSSNPFQSSYRALMTGLFVGIADAFIGLIFNIAYRSSRPDFSSTFLNVSYIIFGMVLLFFFIGLLYAVVCRIFSKSDLIFFLLFGALTILAVWGMHTTRFSGDLIEDASLRGEYTSIAIIAGVSAAVGIPLLHRSHKFELYVV